MECVLVILQLLVLVLDFVRVTRSVQCTNGTISTVNIQEWEGFAVGTIQVCFGDELITPCLSGWNMTNSLVVCRELGLPTKQVGYFMESCQENRERYFGFGCNISGDSLINCNRWEEHNCQCGIGIFCGNISSDQISNTTTSSMCATCGDSDMATASEQTTPANTVDLTNFTTPPGAVGPTAANDSTTLASDKYDTIGNFNLVADKASPLIIVLGGLCAILGVALVGVAFCWSMTCWKLRRMSVSRCHKVKEVTCTKTLKQSSDPKYTSTETNTFYDFPDLSSFSDSKAPSETYHKSSETERLVVEEVDCQEDSMMAEIEGEGHGNGGKGEVGKMLKSDVIYNELEKPQEYEQFYAVVGKDKSKTNETIYNNVETEKLEMNASRESSRKGALTKLIGNDIKSPEKDGMHSVSWQTGGRLGGQVRHDHGDIRKMDKELNLYHVLDKPLEYEEFYSIVGSNDDVDNVNEVVYKNVEKEELKMYTSQESSGKETILSKLVDDEVNENKSAFNFVSEEMGGGRQGKVQERAVGGETDERDVLYINLEKPQEYEIFYKIPGKNEDELDEAVYDIVERKGLEMYSSLCHS